MIPHLIKSLASQTDQNDLDDVDYVITRVKNRVGAEIIGAWGNVYVKNFFTQILNLKIVIRGLSLCNIFSKILGTVANISFSMV